MVHDLQSHNVKIYVGIEPNIKEVHAHSSIICAHCPFFQNALTDAKANLNEFAIKTILKFVILLIT